jgi:hypothetical protein
VFVWGRERTLRVTAPHLGKRKKKGTRRRGIKKKEKKKKEKRKDDRKGKVWTREEG